MNCVTAIIVSYKNEIMTCKFINEELKKCKEIDHIIIVNNAATPESNDKLNKGIDNSEIATNFHYCSSKVIILPNVVNQGFARGNNQGALFAVRYLSPKYLLFTNDDILINDCNVVGELIEKLNSDIHIGCIGPKILKSNGCIQGPSEYLTMWKRYSNFMVYPIAQKIAKAFVTRLRIKRDSLKTEGFKYVVIGCFFLIRVEDFFKAGALDEHTFLYREEEIFAERLKTISKSNYWLPKVSVTHLTAQTTMKGKRPTYNIVNKYTRHSDLYYYHNYMGYPIWQIKLAQGIQYILGLLFQ